jgi:hypothetical protein
MSTPLYKKMKDKGTTFYVFPNAVKDFNLSTFQDNIKISPSKFILLNIPESVTGTTSNPGVLDFVKSTLPETFGTKLYSWDPDGPRSNYKYSESLVEGIRNYISNYDTVFRESKISEKRDFYNPSVNKTPTEMIFWKWCKKMNIIDFEPAVHKVDWDKNLDDFQNPNESSITNIDYFRKYLWKEREIIEYDCLLKQSSNNKPEIQINEISKYKIGDKVFIYGTGYTGSIIDTGISYTIINISFTSNITTLELELPSYTDSINYNCNIKLDYHRLIQYIGEVQSVSKYQTSKNNYTEFTVMIPPHAGQTPSVLFYIEQNSNYYPGLELPIIPSEIQSEINGSEYLNSPIRTNPSNYPGSYFGYFDTEDKTYINSNGDSVRLNGDYYGILRTYNDELNSEDYVEKLTDFNSDNIDGLSIDFNRKHYLKMNLPGLVSKNFDEFNSIPLNNNPPSDFEFNAILWYYDIDDGSGEISTNLYGIEFLNNPDNDFGLDNDRIITTTKKLVTNSKQDGLSYIFNLNLNIVSDNDQLPLKYDTTSTYNLYGFDLYNNVMSSYGKLNENFLTIINQYLPMNKRMNDIESILYSQLDLNEIKTRIDDLEGLIKLYKTNQFADSDTVEIEIDYTKNYPMLKFNSKYVIYDEIFNFNTSDIAKFNLLNTTTEELIGNTKKGSGMVIPVPHKGRTLVNLFSNIVTEYTGITLSLTLDKDLDFKQSIDFIVEPDLCDKLNNLQINIMFDNGMGNGRKETKLVNPFDLPIDVISFDTGGTPTDYNDSYYYDIKTYVDSVLTGSTTRIDVSEGLFESDNWVYIDNFMFDNNGEIQDLSGLYYIKNSYGIQLELDWDTNNIPLILKGKPEIFYYRGLKISIIRINDSNTVDISHRYMIRKEFLSRDFIK